MNKMFEVIGSYEGLNQDTIELINVCKKIKNLDGLLNLNEEDYDNLKKMVKKYIETYWNEDNKHIDLVKGKDGDQFLFRQAVWMLGHLNDEE